MANTEKPTTKTEAKKTTVQTPKQEIKKPIKVPEVKEKKIENKEEKTKEKETDEKKTLEKKPETKKPVVKKVKKDSAKVNAKDVHISTKYSIAICKFIKFKTIEQAIEDLEQVISKKKAVPMKGEIAHKKGRGMMSGKFPKNASKSFIKILNSLAANADNNSIDEPIIAEAIANFASRPLGRFGRTQKKRSHIFVKAMERSKMKKVNKTKKKKSTKINNVKKK